jgi:hypothetical protein
MAKYIREEDDGSVTQVYADDCGGVMKTHNINGPAIINTKQKIKDYYLYGVKQSKEDWEKKRKFS